MNLEPKQVEQHTPAAARFMLVAGHTARAQRFDQRGHCSAKE